MGAEVERTHSRWGMGPDQIATFFRQLLLRGASSNPGLPAPVLPPTEAEIELAREVSTND